MADQSVLYSQLKRKLRMRLAELLENGAVRGGPHPNLNHEVASKQLRLALSAAHPPDAHHQLLSQEEQEQLIHEVLDEVIGYGPLDALLGDASISEIMVNGPNEIFVERDGRLQRLEITFRDEEHLLSVIERMLGSMHLSVTEANPICDASLPDGSRINVIVPPVVLNGPVVTIRRKLREWSMNEYLGVGALSPQVGEFLEGCVRAKVNLILSGGTSTGKTTLVSILSAFIPSDERIITIENVPELELAHQHWIRMVGRPANIEGRGDISLRALVKNALRMRPDRIILGEARGGEALDVVQAMHSGHDGFITVLHANSARAALERLETLMLMSGLDLPPQACRMQIASAADLIVHLSRFADGSRGISSITQVLGASQEAFELEDLFTFELGGSGVGQQAHGTLRYTGVAPKFARKFHLSHVPLPTWINASS